MMNAGLAQKLEAVMMGTLALESVLADPANFSGSSGASFHGLQHFLADADIRAKDCTYREMQFGELQKLIRLLNSDADSESIAKITFLGVSDECAF
jgi:hypothetical protein